MFGPTSSIHLNYSSGQDLFFNNFLHFFTDVPCNKTLSCTWAWNHQHRSENYADESSTTARDNTPKPLPVTSSYYDLGLVSRHFSVADHFSRNSIEFGHFKMTIYRMPGSGKASP